MVPFVRQTLPCGEEDGEPAAPGQHETHWLLDGSGTETQEGSDWLSLSHVTTLRQERAGQSHGKQAHGGAPKGKRNALRRRRERMLSGNGLMMLNSEEVPELSP